MPSNLNYADIAIFIFLAFFILKGLKNGFLQESSMIVGLVVGFLLANRYSAELSTFITIDLDDSKLYAISFGIIIISTILLCALLTRVLASLLDMAFIGFIDHALGAVFGAAKGIVFACIILYLLQLFLFIPLLENSIFMPYYNQIIDMTNTYLTNNPLSL